eukprot:5845389-Pleurochrysis_carterae.AAC.1
MRSLQTHTRELERNPRPGAICTRAWRTSGWKGGRGDAAVSILRRAERRVNGDGQPGVMTDVSGGQDEPQAERASRASRAPRAPLPAKRDAPCEARLLRRGYE